MKRFSILVLVGLFCFFMAGNAVAALYTPSLSDIDTFYEVTSGTLTGPDPGTPITVGSDGTFHVTISDETEGTSTWGNVQIGRDATIEGTGSAYYSGSWADLSGYTTYGLGITNNTTTNDWFMANIYLNTGWTDIGEADTYYENGWQWVSPGQTVYLTLDLTGVSLLNHVSSLGFNIGTNVGTGNYFGDCLEGKATPTPIPGALWLLGSGLVGLVGVRRKFRS